MAGKVVWKWVLRFDKGGTAVLEMPKGARPISVQEQGGYLVMWALVRPNANKENRRFHVYGTGHEIQKEEQLEFIGTVQRYGLVWHIFGERRG